MDPVSRRHTLVFVVVASFLALHARFSPAQTAGVDRPVLTFHGYLLGDVAARATGASPPGGEGGDFVLAEGRLRLEASGSTASGAAFFLAKADGFYDAVTGKPGLDVREAYAGYAKGPWDFRLGRHVVTWGVGDLFFINDVFPKDWNSFFSGRPMEYLKLGVDGLRARFSSGALNAEILAISSFTPDELPSARRFFYYDPFRSVANQREVKPSAGDLGVAELALRLYRDVAGFDVSLYAYRGYWHTPSVETDRPFNPTTATRFFPELAVYGASVQRNLAGGVLSLETGYWDSRQDRPATDPAIPHSQWRFLAGYQRELATDFTAEFQLYGERMENYESYASSIAPGFPRQARFRQVASARLTRFLDYLAWRLSLFAAYSPTDQDYFLRPEVSRKLADNLTVSIGSNVFGGRKPWTFFGQFEKDDNVYFNVRLDF